MAAAVPIGVAISRFLSGFGQGIRGVFTRGFASAARMIPRSARGWTAMGMRAGRQVPGMVGNAASQGGSIAEQAAHASFNVMNALNFGNIAKVLTLDFKANTKKADMGFDQFASRLSRKFLVSGLELSSLRSSLDEINRQFGEAMKEQGLSFASENLALQNQVGTLFAVLKEGSINAGAIMAENIRRALGEVSKDVGSTTEDINNIMQLIPLTHRRTLDQLGMSMSDFSSKALRMQTNVRVGMGEEASDFLNKALAGDLSVDQLKNDRTGIGQLINRQFGMMPFEAISPEHRTQLIAKILNDDEFQTQLEALAERAGGFKLVFKKFFNTLFDSETGIFGVLKNVTIEFYDFSGNLVKSTTTVFKEVTRLTKAIFDPKEGFIATLAKVISDAFGFDVDEPLKIITRVLRFFSDAIEELKNLIQKDPFVDFIEGIGGVFKYFSKIGGMIWNLITRGGFTQTQVDDIQNAINGVVDGIRDKILPFLRDILNTVGVRIQQVLRTIAYMANTITYDGKGLLASIGIFINDLILHIQKIIPLLFQAITSTIQNLVRNFGGLDHLKKGFLVFLSKVAQTVNILIDSIHESIMEPLSKAVKSSEFADFFKKVGQIIGPTIAKLLDTWVNWYILQRESILSAIINMVTPELKASLIKNFQKLANLFVYISKALLTEIVANIGPILWGAVSTLGSVTKNIFQGIVNGITGNTPNTITPPNFNITPPGSTYTTHASGNFFDAVEMERSQSSQFAHPVIANSDEIIIPRGRIEELNTGIENKILEAIKPILDSISYNKDNSFSSLESVIIDQNSSFIKELKSINQQTQSKPSFFAQENRSLSPTNISQNREVYSNEQIITSEHIQNTLAGSIFEDQFNKLTDSIKNLISTLAGSNNIISQPTNLLTNNNNKIIDSTKEIISTWVGSNNIINQPTNLLTNNNNKIIDSTKEIISTRVGSNNIISQPTYQDSIINSTSNNSLKDIKTKFITSLFAGDSNITQSSTINIIKSLINKESKDSIKELFNKWMSSSFQSTSASQQKNIPNTKQSSSLSSFIIPTNSSSLIGLEYLLGSQNQKIISELKNLSKVSDVSPLNKEIITTAKEELSTKDIYQQNKNISGILEATLESTDFLKEINSNTKSQKDLTISSLLKASSQKSTPSPTVQAQVNLPDIELPDLQANAPEFQEKIVEVVKEKIVEKQSESFFDSLKGLIGLGRPKSPPVSVPTPQPVPSTPAPQPSATPSVSRTSNQQPIQVILQVDGNVLADVVLTEINKRVTQINSSD